MKELVLCGGSFTPGPLLQFLSTSPVEKLKFETGYRKPVLANDEFLLAVLEGDRRAQALRYLGLNHYGAPHSSAYLAYPIRGVLSRPENLEAGLENVRHAAMPKWPAGCTEAGLKRVLEAAKKVQVTVTGSALACLDWDRTWDDTLERTAVDVLYPASSERTLVRLLGRERGAHVLREERPGLVALLNGTAGVE